MKHRIRRRAVLRGAFGAVLGLPWLDAFEPRRVRAAESAAPKFFVFLHQANGVAQASAGFTITGQLADAKMEPERFWPSQSGKMTASWLGGEAQCALSELASHAERLLFVRGLSYAFPISSCAHQGAFNQMLTATEPWLDESTGLMSAMGESIDYRIAKALNADGREPLNLASPANSVMSPTMSYRGAKLPRATDNNPWTVYKRMMGLVGADETAAALVAKRRKSVNDLVRSQLKSLLSRNDLSREDRRRLDLHLSSVRDVELKLTCNIGALSDMELDDVGIQDWRNLPLVTTLHMDLIALACACDYSRVATLSVGGCGNAANFALDKYPGAETYNYHQISHRVVRQADSATPIELGQDYHHEIDRIHARFFRYLLDKLASYSTATGSLIDQGIAVWANELGDGPQHAHTNVPWIISGNASGLLLRGDYVNVGDVSHSRMLNTLLNACGIRNEDGSIIDNFGDARLDKGQLDAALAHS